MNYRAKQSEIIYTHRERPSKLLNTYGRASQLDTFEDDQTGRRMWEHDELFRGECGDHAHFDCHSLSTLSIDSHILAKL